MSEPDFPKIFDPRAVEKNIYDRWEASGFFNPDTLPGKRGKPFTIIMPPPNVTGTLHLGHAVMLAVEDLMIRFHRMRGRRTLWLPGTDHAAIATQTKVEREVLLPKKLRRQDLGREKFLAEVEHYVQQSKDTIHRQIRAMGASCDWSREAYTFDEKRSRAVRTAFKMMYDDGLIYRGYRVVNWCPRCQSTLADDEVEYQETTGKFYYFKYGPVVIGTARPETKFLDKTIVVHPDDPRYRALHSKEFAVPWIDGTVRANVITDPTVDREFGTGAMTITPAHDFHDYELAQKYKLPVVQIIDEQGNFTAAAGDLAGKNARASRDEIVRRLNEKGLVDRIEENYVHNLSVCYRCDTPIEPLPKLQWFIDVNKKIGRRGSLKDMMRKAVSSGNIKIVPENFNKIYFHWIDNLRDWNISRQIWFGHQVPVWYRRTTDEITSCLAGRQALRSQRQTIKHVFASPEGTKQSREEMFVGREPPKGEGWAQDPDTMDTWFSAGLWTFSTLGWPEKTKDLKTYHPTDVLETGYDILPFWIARMILMTEYLVDQVPFKTVYLHGLVRDEKGRKMSKSLGNIIDPLDVAEKYGTDAVRLSLVLGMTPGQDTRMSEAKIEGFRNFANKLWNIARFVHTAVLPEQGRGLLLDFARGKIKGKTLADHWILTRLAEVTASVTKKLDAFQFSSAGEELRDFTWGEFADWYVEIAKLQLTTYNLQLTTQQILTHVLNALLKLWHPFMPFVTEEIWGRMFANSEVGSRRSEVGEGFLMVQEWPKLKKLEVRSKNLQVMGEFERVRAIISAIRNIRATNKIPPGQKVDVVVAAGKNKKLIDAHAPLIVGLARVGKIEIVAKAEKPIKATSALAGGVEVFVLLSQVDHEAERGRKEKEASGLRKYITALETRLGSDEFASKAPAHVVAAERVRLHEAQEQLAKLLSG